LWGDLPNIFKEMVLQGFGSHALSFFTMFFYSSFVLICCTETSYLFKDIFLPDRHVVLLLFVTKVILTLVALRIFQASFLDSRWTVNYEERAST